MKLHGYDRRILAPAQDGFAEKYAGNLLGDVADGVPRLKKRGGEASLGLFIFGRILRDKCLERQSR